MDLSAAILEFSDLLQVSARALLAMNRNGQHATAAAALDYIEEVTRIADRLRVISDKLESRTRSMPRW